MKTLVIDQENNAEAWWDAASKAKKAPAVFAKLKAAAGSKHLTVSDKDAEKFVEWASKLPGWADGPAFASNPVNVHDAE